MIPPSDIVRRTRACLERDDPDPHSRVSTEATAALKRLADRADADRESA